MTKKLAKAPKKIAPPKITIRKPVVVQWVYSEAQITVTGATPLAEQLNPFGALGWEAVSIAQLGGERIVNSPTTFYNVVFKKRK